MPLTSNQIKWASLHDWYVATKVDGSIIVADRYSDGSETIMIWQASFAELRAWAGY